MRHPNPRPNAPLAAYLGEAVPSKRGATSVTRGPRLPDELCPLRYIRRDHRGLMPWEESVFKKSEAELISRGGPFATWVLQDLREGKVPFTVCKNPLDGNREWGRYYTAPEFSYDGKPVVETKPLPEKDKSILSKAKGAITNVYDWMSGIMDTISDAGGFLLDKFSDIVEDTGAFLETVVEVFKNGLCAMVDSEWKRRLLQAGAVFASLPPSATDLAIRIARALCALLDILASEVSKSVKAIMALVTVGKFLSV